MSHLAPRTFEARFLGIVLVAAGLVCTIWPASARADNPLPGAQLLTIFPPGGKQGATVDVAHQRQRFGRCHVADVFASGIVGRAEGRHVGGR